jgi:hypothetical protein
MSLETLPAAGDGISIVALSDSSVMSDCSLLIASPGLTSTSMTSTSLKSPMSGTFTSVPVMIKAYGWGIWRSRQIFLARKSLISR